MRIDLPSALGLAYRSSSQKARVISEAWALDNLFCPACPSNQLAATPANTRSVDFACPMCGQLYQLKAKSSRFSERVVDGSYHAMLSALSSDQAPNLCLMHYDRLEWKLRDLIMIPHFALPQSAIVERKPLSATARRAGWIGCLIQLTNVPPDSKIEIVKGGVPQSASDVRRHFERLRPLKQLSFGERGWALDVLNEIRKVGKAKFTTAQMYERAPELARLHPKNQHVREKIRQQLQYLRDHGFLLHVRRNVWQLINSNSTES